MKHPGYSNVYMYVVFKLFTTPTVALPNKRSSVVCICRLTWQRSVRVICRPFISKANLDIWALVVCVSEDNSHIRGNPNYLTNQQNYSIGHPISLGVFWVYTVLTVGSCNNTHRDTSRHASDVRVCVCSNIQYYYSYRFPINTVSLGNINTACRGTLFIYRSNKSQEMLARGYSACYTLIRTLTMIDAPSVVPIILTFHCVAGGSDVQRSFLLTQSGSWQRRSS